MNPMFFVGISFVSSATWLATESLWDTLLAATIWLGAALIVDVIDTFKKG